MRLEELLQKTDGVIFDLDGTLADSMWLWRDIDIAYFKKYSMELPDDFQSCIEGMSFTETAIYTKERFQIPDCVETIMKEWNEMAYDYYMHRVNLKPGAMEFLHILQERGIKMGIATSNSHELVDNLAIRFGLDRYLTCIVTGCDVQRGKPAPDVYLKAAEYMQVLPEKCLVFEDIPAGIMAGKNAGMRVCAVYDAYSEDQTEEKKRLADYYIEDYTEFLK